MTEPLTKPQRAALEAAQQYGSVMHGLGGSRVSVALMCRTLSARGLVEPHHPYKITAKGRAALRWKGDDDVSRN